MRPLNTAPYSSSAKFDECEQKNTICGAKLRHSSVFTGLAHTKINKYSFVCTTFVRITRPGEKKKEWTHPLGGVRERHRERGGRKGWMDMKGETVQVCGSRCSRFFHPRPYVRKRTYGSRTKKACTRCFTNILKRCTKRLLPPIDFTNLEFWDARHRPLCKVPVMQKNSFSTQA